MVTRQGYLPCSCRLPSMESLGESAAAVCPAPAPAKRQRRANFFSSEISVLVDEVEKRISVINASFSSTVTNKTKSRCWEEIANRLCAESAVARSAADARKKWNDLKVLLKDTMKPCIQPWDTKNSIVHSCMCQTKKKAQLQKRECQRTGGGPAPAPLTELELKILSLIPTCQVDGVSGGLETGVLTQEAAEEQTDDGTVIVEPALPDCSLASTPSPTEQSSSTDLSDTDTEARPQHKPVVTKQSLKPSITSPVGLVMDIEKQKLAALQEMVLLERERLAVEMQRLAVETERLSIEKAKYEEDQLLKHFTV